jgi:hypothetical protein
MTSRDVWVGSTAEWKWRVQYLALPSIYLFSSLFYDVSTIIHSITVLFYCIDGSILLHRVYKVPTEFCVS